MDFNASDWHIFPLIGGMVCVRTGGLPIIQYLYVLTPPDWPDSAFFKAEVAMNDEGGYLLLPEFLPINHRQSILLIDCIPIDKEEPSLLYSRIQPPSYFPSPKEQYICLWISTSTTNTVTVGLLYIVRKWQSF